MNFRSTERKGMLITVQRFQFTEESTIGRMYIDGVFEAFTLEDKARPNEPKVYGKTAIPEGHYQVIIDYSNHFGRQMPHILNVPNFEGIRIHAGNKAEDTDGCILIGKTQGEDFIGHSREEFESFFAKLQNAQSKVFIDISSQNKN